MSHRPPKILSDEPRLSSAALCTTLKHLNQTFRPEFTHQCVEEETFRGHQPLTSVLEQEAAQTLSLSLSSSSSSCSARSDDNARAVLHKSHLHHEQATNELEIIIDLAPSCRTCRLRILSSTSTAPKNKRPAKHDEIMTDNNSNNKRQKLDDDSSKIESLHSSTTTTNTNETEVEPMSRTEIQDSIAKALPDIVTVGAMKDCDDSDDYLSTPIGTVLREYTINDDDEHDTTFCLSLANGSDPATCDYHAKVQKLALWFVENADDVDVSNDQSGYWKVLYLFVQSSSKGYALVGYCTLFHFNSPFHKPVPGTIVRICQALVLPPFQGQGHGKRMMECIYDAVHNRIIKGGAYTKSDDDQEVVQINVEDPAPGFVALRNKVDWKLFQDHPEYWSSSSSSSNNNNNAKKVDICDEKFFASIPEAEAVQVGARAKITPHQVHIVHELQTLVALNDAADDDGDDDGDGTMRVSKEELERRYRLLVKRRLNRDHSEDLSSFATKDAKKAYLAKLFDEQLALYNKLLKKKGSSKR